MYKTVSVSALMLLDHQARAEKLAVLTVIVLPDGLESEGLKLEGLKIGVD